MKIITQDEMAKEIEQGLIDGYNCVIVDYQKDTITYGVDTKPNVENCQKNNVKPIDLKRCGGTIVAKAGDLGYGKIFKGFDNDLETRIISKFIEFLQSKNLSAIRGGNDILVDGYKVFSTALNYFGYKDLSFITIHCPMSVDIDAINTYCIKPMNKTPKGLGEFGITREEVIEVLKTFENI